MKILISNDDGITAPGIHALSRAFAEAGHDVAVIAPDAQRSAASHSMTLFAPLKVRKAHVPGARLAFAVSGTPADCVKLGLRNLCPEAEFVVSGVNHGYNAGSDVLYSGTEPAAMEWEPWRGGPPWPYRWPQPGGHLRPCRADGASGF